MAYPSDTETSELAFSGPGIQPYSGRGLTQSLEPQDNAGVVRQTINGVLRDFSAPQFRLYKSTISCTDAMAPAFDGIWPGMILTVDCAKYLAYKTAGGSPERPVVPDSSYTYGDFTFYRPRLTMMVLPGSPKQSFDEYKAANSWSIDLAEVGETVTA
jgi:hypothetical protein